MLTLWVIHQEWRFVRFKTAIIDRLNANEDAVVQKILDIKTALKLVNV
jgi:hypothetical protein